MQAAFQRHTDNAVSKTINFRASATVEDVERAYLLAYREGCKGITIYRDQSRPLQVLSHATRARAGAGRGAGGGAGARRGAAFLPDDLPARTRLPDERRSITHKFRVGEQEGYVTVGLFDDGRPGEVFITISKEGSTIRGLMDSVAVLTSLALQYGVPLEDLVRKFRGVHFEPAGFTDNPELPQASSIVDYIFRWLERRFLSGGSGVKGQGPRTKGRGSRVEGRGSSAKHRGASRTHRPAWRAPSAAACSSSPRAASSAAPAATRSAGRAERPNAAARDSYPLRRGRTLALSMPEAVDADRRRSSD